MSGLAQRPQSGRNKITLLVVVAGRRAQVDVNVNAPIRNLIREALRETGNVGQPEGNWELKTEGGLVLDPDSKLADYEVQDGAVLFLNPHEGAGG